MNLGMTSAIAGLLYLLVVAGLAAFVVLLALRFVRAQERKAVALERIAAVLPDALRQRG